MDQIFSPSHCPSKQIKPPPSSLWSSPFDIKNASLFPSNDQFESVTVQQELLMHAKDLTARISHRQELIAKLQKELALDQEALLLVQAKIGAQSEQQVCRQWNRGECYKGSNCTYQHVCMTCKGPHNQMRCPEKEDPKSKEPCIKWNYGECQWNERCHRQHVCLSCGDQHRLILCPAPTVIKTKDVCLNWNEGRCRAGDNCMRIHECRHCKSSEHIGLNCDKKTQRLTTDAAPNSDVCINWNEGKCRLSDRCHRIHKCLRCGSFRHSAIKCTVVNRCHSDEQQQQQQNVVYYQPVVRTSRSENGSPSKQVTQLNSNFTVGRFHNVEDEICLNYNNNKCLLDDKCRRKHVCSLCRSDDHTILQCPNTKDVFDYIAAGIEICYNYNQNRCHIGVEVRNPAVTAVSVGSQCLRLHCCNVCHKSHPQCENH